MMFKFWFSREAGKFPFNEMVLQVIRLFLKMFPMKKISSRDIEYSGEGISGFEIFNLLSALKAENLYDDGLSQAGFQ